MSDKQSIEKAACARNRADDQLKHFIEHKKREIKKLQTFLNSIDWDSLTTEQEYDLASVVSDLISADHRQRRY